MSRIVTLLTDFGTADGYVGEMKGSLLSLAPAVTLVDIAHDVPPHDVRVASLTLARYWLRFPAGTVHLVVVDPGVGSTRRAIAVESEGRYLVGPDNGVLSPALIGHDVRAVVVPVGADASPTFHGRDVFVPAVARLTAGATLSTLGEGTRATVLTTPEPEPNATGWRGEIIAVDRFGNAITNLPAGIRRVVVGSRELPIVRTYADLAPGAAGALVGSSGLIEIAVREGSAAAVLGLKRGERVEGRG